MKRVADSLAAATEMRPGRGLFQGAESAGGVECYLIEQEGNRFPFLETAERCLANWKKLKGLLTGTPARPSRFRRR